MFMSLLLTLFPLGLLLITSYVFVYWFCNHHDHNKALLHGPPSYPIIGCLISFYQNRFRLLDWYTDLLACSPTQTIVVKRLGGPRTIVTANPENVEYILKTNFNNYPKGKPFSDILGDLLGKGIFNVDGELWRAQRKLASHGFTTNCLREYIMDAFKGEVENRLIPILESAMKENKVIDMQEMLKRFAFDVICKVSLGTDMGYLDPSLPVSPLASAFDIASMISAKRGMTPMAMVWKIKRALGVGSEQQLKDAIKHVHECVIDIIHKKKKNITNGQAEMEECGDMLSRLIAAGHDEDVIRDMVISFIMAGKDTTSAVMTWLFWLLSQHPHIEEEVVKELNSNNNINGGERSSLEYYEGLKNEMGLMKACICESLRLYPPVPWDSKHAAVGDRLPDGTVVQRGDRVTYFPYGMGRMEGLWGKDRLEFKPGRWLLEPEKEGGELKNVSPYKFPVFQAGPRVCLGKEMAFLQMKYVVACVLKRFQIRPIWSEETVFVPLLTAHMAGGLRVTVRERGLLIV